ncbi:MAG: ribosome small subunit-dependent GTPase A [Armatimonadetes bacterium]|nr:ribosome small subunit-dependent GTPase A [Armatimonadota bacterium]
MNLTRYGWNNHLTGAFREHEAAGRVPVRISLQVKNHYLALTEIGEIAAEPTGRLRYDAVTPQDFPVVGDWAAATILEESAPRAQIHAVFARKSLFCRKEAGKRVVAQPVAANVDIVLIAVALDYDYSPNRIERYLALSRECGASPVVLLTKSDACADSTSKVDDVKMRMPDLPVIAISSVDGTGMDLLHEYLQPGVTCAVLGSSGVGKSTLINRLLGADVLKTREVRLTDSKGRHTTANRQLLVLPSGALVVDTPGMRELQLWDAREGISQTFPDIAELSSECHFPDCRHADEPGCAVLTAMADGLIDPAHLENYRKMSRELDYLSLRQEEGVARLERARWKNISKQAKQMKKM